MNQGMKLSTWAKSKGIGYRAAYNQLKSGVFPCPFEQLATGTYVVYPENTKSGNTVIYCRVSSHDQKADLARQLDRVRSFCAVKGWTVFKEVTEVASGLNDHRKGLLSILSDATVTRVVVEHRDRLARFGVASLASSLAAAGRQVVAINETEQKDDLVQDFVDVVTSMCARIYGKRSAKNKAKKMLDAAKEEA